MTRKRTFALADRKLLGQTCHEECPGLRWPGEVTLCGVYLTDVYTSRHPGEDGRYRRCFACLHDENPEQ
jgi:hypothetical protein